MPCIHFYYVTKWYLILVVHACRNELFLLISLLITYNHYNTLKPFRTKLLMKKRHFPTYDIADNNNTNDTLNSTNF